MPWYIIIGLLKIDKNTVNFSIGLIHFLENSFENDTVVFKFEVAPKAPLSGSSKTQGNGGGFNFPIQNQRVQFGHRTHNTQATVVGGELTVPLALV